MAETQPIRFARGVALTIKRFDRTGGRRLHALSANVALKAAGVPAASVEELARHIDRPFLLRQRSGQ